MSDHVVDVMSSPEARRLLDWLMAGDPAVRWQTMRDLLDAPDDAVADERARVATTGWGARLLAEQDTDGRWGGGLYSPKWTSTTHTLLLLQRLGLPPTHPQARVGVRLLWDGAWSYDGGLTLAATIAAPETCITGMLVLLAVAFDVADARVDAAARWLTGQQLADGGWNCESIRWGSTHGSFHTTITVLEALHAYHRGHDVLPIGRALRAGRAFLLAHRLYRSHRTGEVVDPAMTRFPFPPQWRYDVLRALEHFRAVGAARDERMSDAVGEVARRRRHDGTWPVYRPYAGRYWFELEPHGAGRMTTLRALRVLRWWEALPPPTT